MTAAEQAVGRKLRGWREARGILRFVDEELKAQPDPWQRQALEAFASPKPEHRRISLQACAGPGKSAVLAWCGLWFLGVQGDVHDHPKGFATSVTGDNLKANLWAEYANWLARSTWMSNRFTWTASRIFCDDHPATWFLEARTWPKTANADEQGKTFSGLHAKYVLAQVDESGGVPSTILRAAEQALSVCAFGKILQAGNPISLEGMLYEAANRLAHQWLVIRITGDPDDPQAWVYAPRVGPGPLAWAQEQIATYGRENPWVKSYILGQFPPASINSLLGYEDVEAAMKRFGALHRERFEWAQKRLGVDVARFGDDRSVIFPRQGAAAFRPIVMRGERTTAIAARVARASIKWDAELVLVDDSGHWGHGVIDNLVTAGYPALGILSEDRAIERRYKNRRAEMWLGMADWVKAGGALPPYLTEITAELTTPTYTFLAGQFVIEPKDQIKKRLGRSPDLADALALTFALPDQPGKLMAQLRGGQHAKTLDDPYETDTERRERDGYNPFES